MTRGTYSVDESVAYRLAELAQTERRSLSSMAGILIERALSAGGSAEAKDELREPRLLPARRVPDAAAALPPAESASTFKAEPFEEAP